MKIVFALVLCLFSISLKAQYTQQLRGTITDQVLQKPLTGATVSIAEIGKTVSTDESGVFRFRDVPVGQHRITITFSGYKEMVLDNVVVNSGKETVINASLDAMIKTEAEVLLKQAVKRISHSMI